MGKSKAVKVITYILLVLVLIGGIGLIGFVASADANVYRLFEVSWNDTHYRAGTFDGGYVVTPDTPIKISYEMTLTPLVDCPHNVHIEIVRNPLYNFSYSVNGTLYFWGDQDDEWVTRMYECVDEHSTYDRMKGKFSGYVVVQGDFSIQHCLDLMWPNCDIEILDGQVDPNADYYQLLVWTDVSPKGKVVIGFHDDVTAVRAISLSKDIIVF